MEVGFWGLLARGGVARRDGLRGEWRRNRATIVAAALMSPTAYLLVLFAFQLSKTGYVVAAREMSIVLSAIIGAAWMNEGAAARRLRGAAVRLARAAARGFARVARPALRPAPHS